jgi:cytochrome c
MPDEVFGEMTRAGARRLFYSVALAATAAQLLFGPLLYLTLPARTLSWEMTLVVAGGLALMFLVLWLMWKEVEERDETVGRRFRPLLAVLALLVLLMGTARHMIRETAIEPHRQQVAARTSDYMARVHQARDYAVVPGGLGEKAIAPGEALFRRTCAACHAENQRLVGPPLTEIIAVYAGNPEGIVSWSLAPGRKREDYPAMPAQNLPEEDLRLVAQFVLGSGG